MQECLTFLATLIEIAALGVIVLAAYAASQPPSAAAEPPPIPRLPECQRNAILRSAILKAKWGTALTPWEQMRYESITAKDIETILHPKQKKARVKPLKRVTRKAA